DEAEIAPVLLGGIEAEVARSEADQYRGRSDGLGDPRSGGAGVDLKPLPGRPLLVPVGVRSSGRDQEKQKTGPQAERRPSIGHGYLLLKIRPRRENEILVGEGAWVRPLSEGLPPRSFR